MMLSYLGNASGFKGADLAQYQHNYEKKFTQGKEIQKLWRTEETEEPTLGKQMLCCFVCLFQKSIQQIVHLVLNKWAMGQV